tara:strand:+ start:4387 stop:5043 length:657 start_codon:yes stop_codon:yes gene_type:complete
MKFDIKGNPSYGEVDIELGPEEIILIEPGAMSRMDSHLNSSYQRQGGFFSAMFRKMFGGESFFLGKYGHKNGGKLTFAPAVPGSVERYFLSNNKLNIMAGSFLACTPGVNIKAKFGGLKALFSGEGAFLLEASGNGDLFFNSFGGIVEKKIEGDFIVDSGHVVAFEPSLNYKISGMGNWKSTMLSGEGLVMTFNGSGKIYLQTRTIDSLASWLTPRLL